MSCCKAVERQNVSFTLSWWLDDLCTCITIHQRHQTARLESSADLELCAGLGCKPFFIIKHETNMFKEQLHGVSAHGVPMLCHNILSERQDSIPWWKTMCVKDTKKTYFKAVKMETKISFPGNLPPAGQLPDISIFVSIFFPLWKYIFKESEHVQEFGMTLSE